MTNTVTASSEVTAADEQASNSEISDMWLAERFHERFDGMQGAHLVGTAKADYCVTNAANTVGIVHTGEVSTLEGNPTVTVLDDYEPVENTLELVNRGRIGIANGYELRHPDGVSFYSATYVIPVAQFLETSVDDLELSIYGDEDPVLLRIEVPGSPWVVLIAPMLTS